MFYFTRNIFGDIGLKPTKEEVVDETETAEEATRNPFSKFDLGIIAIVAIVGLLWTINDPLSKITSSYLKKGALRDIERPFFIDHLAVMLKVYKTIGY